MSATKTSGNGYALYNGVKLPALPETTYPYAIVAKSDKYYLYLSEAKNYAKGSTGCIGAGAYACFTYDIGSTASAWTAADSGTLESDTGWAVAPFWSNHEIINQTDSSVFLAATDPIPLDDTTVYEDEYSVKSAGLIATAEAIRAKTGGTGKIAWSNETGFKTAVDAITTGSGGDKPTDCLMFLGDSGDFTLSSSGDPWDGTLEYSTNKTDWVEWHGEEVQSVNSRLYLRGRENTYISTSASDCTFALSGPAKCIGNIQTLLQYDNPPDNHAYFACLFEGCTNLTQAPDLPATTVPGYGYWDMFSGCTNLTVAPELPALNLGDFCYQEMFYGCTRLLAAPKLPATVLSPYCYCAMFYGCVSLQAEAYMSGRQLAEACFYAMYSGCVSLVRPDNKITTGELPALCYAEMYSGCRNIRLSTTKTDMYSIEYKIPLNGTATDPDGNAVAQMFSNTGGSFTGTPELNTKYYLAATTTVDNPVPREISTEDEMTALLETATVGSVYKYTGETGDTYENGGLYIVEEAE